MELWIDTSKASEWAWLCGQVGHMLAAAAESDGQIRHDVTALGNSIRAYALAILDQKDEARRAFEVNPLPSIHHRRTALDHAVRALTLLKLRMAQPAQEEIIQAVKRGFTSIRDHTNEAVQLCLEEYSSRTAELGRVEDMVEVIRHGGPRLRHFLVADLEAQAEHPRLAALFFEALGRIRHPVGWVRSNLRKPGGNSRAMPGLLFKAVAADFDRVDDALELFRCLVSLQLPVPSGSALRLADELVGKLRKTDAMEIFDYLFRTPRALPHNALTNRLRISVEGGAKETAELVWRAIQRDYEPTPSDRFLAARLEALSGSVQRVKEVLGREVDESDSTTGLRVVLDAQIHANNAAGAAETLDRILAKTTRIEPFTAVLVLYARQADVEGAQRVYDKLLSAGIRPDLKTYTTMISLYARKRDPTNAQAMFREMVDFGIEPDAVAWSAVINADVEAGDWVAAAQKWSIIPSSMRQHESVVASMIKAFVLVGAPPDVVIKLFREVENPGPHLWALVIQSASDAYDITLMRELFEEMDKKSLSSTTTPRPGVYVFSILLHGYLRTVRSQDAKAVYDEMLLRKIVPSSITYAMIISSFANGSFTGGYQQAQDFAMSVHRLVHASTHIESPMSRGKVTENLLSPLIVAAGASGRPEEAQRFFDLIMERQEPTVLLYSQLMDAYRRAGDVRAVMSIWADTLDLACRSIPLKSVRSTDSVPRRMQENALCIPLSIVMDVLASTNDLVRLRDVWNKVRSAGFGFDAANYNHFSVALAKCGDVEGAFRICENVLLKRQRFLQWQSHQVAAAAREGGQQPGQRDMDAEVEVSPYADHVAGAEQGSDVDVTGEAAGAEINESYARHDPEHEHDRETHATSGFRPPNRRTENRLASEPDQASLLDIAGLRGRGSTHDSGGNGRGNGNENGTGLGSTLSDPTKYLQAQHYLWRPFQATIAALDQTLSQCEQWRDRRAWLALAEDEGEEVDGAGNGNGNAVRSGEVGEVGEVGEMVTLPDFGTMVREQDGRPKRTTPRALILRLNKRYGRTMALVMLYRKKQISKWTRGRSVRERDE